MELTLADLSLPAIDASASDAVALFVRKGERPLQGLAGLCDWRLCGALSRVVRSGFFQGTLGETLLTPGRGRIPSARVFVFGVGDRVDVAGKALLRKALEVCQRAGVRTLGLSVEALPLEAEEKPRVFLELARHTGLSRFVLFGDARRLQRAIEPLLSPGERVVPAHSAAVTQPPPMHSSSVEA
jgi:hypothetical protein